MLLRFHLRFPVCIYVICLYQVAGTYQPCMTENQELKQTKLWSICVYFIHLKCTDYCEQPYYQTINWHFPSKWDVGLSTKYVNMTFWVQTINAAMWRVNEWALFFVLKPLTLAAWWDFHIGIAAVQSEVFIFWNLVAFVSWLEIQLCILCLCQGLPK